MKSFNDHSFKTKYVKIREKFSDSETGYYYSFGIAAVRNGSVVAKVSDLTESETEIDILLNECNRSDLDPVHLSDVAKDYIMKKGFLRE